ncbi:MAG: cytochrome c peroxidase, partial [Blastocatellia bacterium]
GDPRRDELRNSPTILDAGLMPRLHFDGEFASLEALVKGTLAGRPMGWLPGEEAQAFDRIYSTILNDRGGNYRSDFKAAYGVELAKVGRRELVEHVTTAIADYMRTLRSERTTPYDRFVKDNALGAGPEQGEEPKLFASRLLARVTALEAKRTLKLSSSFDETALRGMKVFFTTSGNSASGNCVACHTPPLFTDFSFHNMGISQSEYDRVNGEGSFAKLEIPASSQARRPSAQFREIPSKLKPGCVDLGHWNFVDLKSSTLRRAGESDDQFLRRMISAFKTPTLRNLVFSQPYMHTGGFTSVESALVELMRLSEMARAGQVREGDEELVRIKISEADIAPLTAFLNTLNEDLKPASKY